MHRLALNFICKNESHIIRRMLESAKPITDLIVAIDTGSTDGTQQIIQQFGSENNIPTYVFEHPFDTFSLSRNKALQHLQKVVDDLHWDKENVWGFWADCDERFLIESDFKKESLEKDIYNVMGEIEQFSYAHSCFFRLSKDFYWYGPVHETIMWNNPEIKVALLPYILIKGDKAGYSWKGDLEAKYIRYAQMLEDFINTKDRSERWVLYTAQSFGVASEFSKNPENRKKWLTKALQYFQERAQMISVPESQNEEQAYAQLQVGKILCLLEHPWPVVKAALVNAYRLDPLRAEPLMQMILHYKIEKDWSKAYRYSTLALKTFQGKCPLGKRFIGLAPSLYNWKLLWEHYLICSCSARKIEMIETYNRIKMLIREHPEYFLQEDILFIKIHSPLVLSINRRIEYYKNWVKGNFPKTKITYIKIKKPMTSQVKMGKTPYQDKDSEPENE